jgi:perosamine synthetase
MSSPKAVAGGPALMTTPQSSTIPFHVADIGEAEIAAVIATLQSGWLTSGPRVREFEERFAQFVGARHAVADNSGTAALHLALDAIGLTAGDEVIVPTMTFAATAEVVHYFGAIPRLVDCDPETLTLRAEDLEPAITSRTKAVIPVDFGGHPCDLDPILDLARARNITVIEDAAHALPADYRGRRIGSVSDLTTFSFYATKTLTTGEGGMLTTDTADDAERARIMSLHGISRHAWNRYSVEGTWRYEILHPGFKYNLTDIAAAIGLVQLRRAEAMWHARKCIAERYDAAFADVPQIDRPVRRIDVQPAFHLYPIRLCLERLRIGRDEFIERLREQGIGTSVHFIPLHLHPYYQRSFGYRAEDCPNAAAAYERLISLPIYPTLGDENVDRIVKAVRDLADTSAR